MHSRRLIASLAVATAVGIHDAQAHVYLTEPLAEFPKGASKSSWVAEFKPAWEGTFKTGAQYAAKAKAEGIPDLRTFLEDKGPVCGNSLKDATPKAIPASGKISLASTIEHAGPCEVWFDDVLAFHDDDCEKTFGSATSFAVDFSKCSGSCLLRFYWLGLQDGGKRWQSYKNCVPLKGGTGTGTPTTPSKPVSNSTTPSVTPNATPATDTKTKKPATTKKPKKTKAPTTEEPAAEASMPPSPAKAPAKCNRSLDD